MYTGILTDLHVKSAAFEIAPVSKSMADELVRLGVHFSLLDLLDAWTEQCRVGKPTLMPKEAAHPNNPFVWHLARESAASLLAAIARATSESPLDASIGKSIVLNIVIRTGSLQYS
jgi:hypothetical protein